MTGEPAGAPARLGPGAFRLAALLWWTYLWAAFVYDDGVAGIQFGAVAAAAVFLVGVGAAALAPAGRWLTPTRMLEVGLTAISLLAAVLVADFALTVRDNGRRAAALAPLEASARLADRQVLHGEIYPRTYFPTDRNFFLYKPNTSTTGTIYGQFYAPGMLRSRTLADSVLQLRRVTYAIGPQGLRERESLAGSRIFALGDSFVLGYATDEGGTWPDVLGAALGQPVYNLGVSNTGPRQQLELLSYLLQTRRDSMRVGHVLWMIFENDLENSYARTRPAEARPSKLRVLLDGTLPYLFASIPSRVKEQSVLRRLVSGELKLRGRSGAGLPGAKYEIDGVTLGLPLFHSARWGWMLFNSQEVLEASWSRQRVLGHPNRPLLDSTFAEMRALSVREGFRVTVVLAPSVARLYGAEFDDFPRPSPDAHFLQYVAALSSRQGFAVVDLLHELRPFAKKEMLYYRDDHHWNERGNAVVAQLLGQVTGTPLQSATEPAPAPSSRP